MNEKCSQCGGQLPGGALAGFCPTCLLREGVAADTATQPENTSFDAPPLAELARLFPQLEIIGLLGKGGMGAVYKARQPALDRFVALKILPTQTRPDAGFAERFTREARALARLNHPNIVALYEFGQVEGWHYFIMEYVDGANLRQLQRLGLLSAREALQIVPQICDALQFAHDEGVVHRDIKPENVLVDRKRRVKIADFGLAKILGRPAQDLRLTCEGQVMGTPNYMAPEQIEHPLEVDHRADIFSLGVVIYEMLTGELPLGRFAPPSRKAQVDVRMDDVVLHALEKEPQLRYQQASHVKTDVLTITESKTRVLPHAAAPTGKRRLVLEAVGLASALVLGIGATLLWLHRAPELSSPGKPAIAVAQPLVEGSETNSTLVTNSSPTILNAVEKVPETQNVYTASGGVLPSAQGGNASTRGLAAQWHAEGTMLDGVGGKDGIPHGGVTFAPGRVGKAFSFDGRTGYIEVPSSPSISPTGPFSVAGWVRYTRLYNDISGSVILAKGQDVYEAPVDYTLSVSHLRKLRPHVMVPAGWTYFDCETTLEPDTWYHVAMVYDGANLKGYVNGELDGSQPARGPVQATDESFKIGAYAPVNGGQTKAFWTGQIDELTLYNRALSDSEIKDIYTAAGGSPDSPPRKNTGPIARWHADGNGRDSVGTNHAFSLRGVEFAKGVFGQAFKFNGDGASVNIMGSPALDLANQVTVEFWMKADSDNKMQGYQGLVTSEFYGVSIANGYSSGMGVMFFISTDGGAQTAPSSWPNTADANGGGAPVSAGRWHHIAGTYDGTKLQLYMDGRPQGRPAYHSGPISPMQRGNFISIGSEEGRTLESEVTHTRYFNGLIDEVGLYERALSAEEIAEIYGVGRDALEEKATP